jgi:hypothetical protein
MKLFSARQNSSSRASTSAPRRLLLVVGFAAMSSATSLLGQPAPAADDTTNPRRRRNQEEGATGRANFTPQDMQARMMTALRERFEVTDDEEWKLISERLTAVMELRRSTTGGGFGVGVFGGRGGPGGPGGNSDNPNRAARGPRGGGGSTELAALSTAVRDKMPDAEIKARLERVRESRKDNETKLAKAQEDLRALLSVRQEAAAVVAGLLP